MLLILKNAAFLTSLLAASLLFVGGCQTVNTTQGGLVGVNRTQIMSPLVSSQQLEQQATLTYSSLLTKETQKGDLNPDPAQTARVRRIASRLIPQTAVFRPDALKWNWQVNVIRSDEVNAWCMPGGKIAIYTGIITQLKLSDDEIAAIMGHEIAHALREHAREQASEQSLAQIGMVGAVLAGAGQNTVNTAGQLYQLGIGLPHSRTHETEADRIGVELAARAGYDPRAAIGMWQKMAQLGGSKPPEFLSTHPSAATRMADLQVYAAKVMPLYQQSKRN
ncbi:M48 family metallopeptidase [Sulfuriferula sp.]|uniref:M48 family metallopeptidase n=1 Tax=Sulfuriferula sp. TaxID=2025307 RepID=UPI00272EFD90|nr:M48 family metallopeptidase [Sulfuriferula sp.]MDP2027847.1 M48 family metallopeptidase [Sulfuriferula sp.]